MNGGRTAFLSGALTAMMLMIGAVLHAHSGPPYPIVLDQIAGQYKISIWTDPDATDDGSAAGKFWVMVDPAQKGSALPPNTRVTVSIQPLDRPGPVVTGPADPVGDDATRRFVALVMDHEGHYAVKATVDGPGGPASFDAAADATYDTRPRPFMLILALVPFLLIGFVWMKLLVRRRSARG